MEQIREYYRRFCRWQQEKPHFVNRHEGKVQHCHNCGNDFDGNFCPICVSVPKWGAWDGSLSKTT